MEEREYRHGVHGYIFKFFGSLKHLSISGPRSLLILRDSSSTTCSSFILTKLCVFVDRFQSCLDLLDGRLKQSTTFIVKIKFLKPASVHNMVGLSLIRIFCKLK